MQCSPRSYSSSLLQRGAWFTLCALLLVLVLLTANVAVAQRTVAVNSVTNKIYAVNASTRVTVIDGATNAITTVKTGSYALAVAVNEVTNKIYVANYASNSVTVIDGATNATATVAVGNSPVDLAVNSVTNKIYVANSAGNNVTVINGATNATTTVIAGSQPESVAINSVTNKIYVGHYVSGPVTVIDGATNATSTVPVGEWHHAVVTNEKTNKIYVTNEGSGNVTVIDGATNTTTTVASGTQPLGVAVNQVTNKVYVANYTGSSVTVIDGMTNSAGTVSVSPNPWDVAVNPVTNKIYVSHLGSGSDEVTVIDGTMPLMISPPSGSKLPGSKVTFTWTGGMGTKDYKLSVGTLQGGHDIDLVNAGGATSATVENIPTIGATLFVALSSSSGTSTYTYTEAKAGTPTPGTMISPAPGSTLTSSTVTFQWKAGEGVSRYTMYLGRYPETHDINALDAGLSTSATVTNIPTVGRKFYVTLYSYINGAYQPEVYDYNESISSKSIPATIISPVPGSIIMGKEAVFTWNPGEGVDGYSLYVGTTPGAHDVAMVDAIYNTTARVKVPTLGAALYVTLYSLMSTTGTYQSRAYVYTQYGTPAPASMVSPAGGSKLTGSSATFTWDTGTGATAYTLYAGTTSGAHDVAFVNAGKSLSATLTKIPTDGGQLFVRLYSFYGSSSLKDWRDYVYSEAGTPVAATMISPAPGTKLSGSSATFTWSPGGGVTQYSLYVGTHPGEHDVSYVNAGRKTSTTVSNLPRNGGTLFVTLWSNFGGTFQSNAYTYVAAGTPVKAAMLSPTNGSTLTGNSATFTWSAGTGVTSYNLYVGSAPGTHDLGFWNAGTNTSTTVSNIPTIGGTIHVTLFSQINGSLQSNAYSYKESTAGTPTPATIMSPAPGSKLSGATATFMWTTGAGVSSYNLYLGSSPGMHDIAFVAAGFQTSATVNNIPVNGGTIYATLNSKINGAYQSRSYVYIAAGTAAKATMTSPANGSTLSGSSATFTWTKGTGASSYNLYIGSTPGAHDIAFVSAGLNTSTTVTNIPTDGALIYVTLYSLMAGEYGANSYTYTEAGTAAAATMLSPAPGSTLSGSSATFTWTAGTGVSQYSLYLGTLPGGRDLGFVNAHLLTTATVNNLPTTGHPIYVTLFSWIAGAYQTNSYTYTQAGGSPASMITPAPGSTVAGTSETFAWDDGIKVNQYSLYVGTSPGKHDVAFVNAGMNKAATVSGIPATGGALYITLYSWIEGKYKSNSYMYTQSGTAAGATMISPVPGSTLTGSSATFTWTAGSGVSQYSLYVGTSAGKHDLDFVNAGMQTTATVNNLPTSGGPIYVTLFSWVAGKQLSSQYTYIPATSGVKATMLSPANGSTLSGASATFTWTAGTGVTNYSLYVGKSPGSHEYDVVPTVATSATITNLPADGSTLFVQLNSYIAGAWQSAGYSYVSGP